jgi:septal ring factor EnvC (AmiA/AmiB activator)
MSDTMKLQCELDHKTQEVAKLQQELATVKSDKSGLKQKVYELSAEVAKLQQELADKDKAIATEQANRDRWRTVAEKVEAKLQAENNRLSGLIDFHKKESTDRAIKLRNLDKEIARLKALVYRMSIINPNGYPEPMEKMIADIYNERQRQADEEYEQEKDSDSRR